MKIRNPKMSFGNRSGLAKRFLDVQNPNMSFGNRSGLTAEVLFLFYGPKAPGAHILFIKYIYLYFKYFFNCLLNCLLYCLLYCLLDCLLHCLLHCLLRCGAPIGPGVELLIREKLGPRVCGLAASWCRTGF